MIVDHDITKSALMMSGIAGKDAGGLAYDVDYAYVNYYLSQGHNVIMDSPCFYDIQLKRSIDAAQLNNAVYKYIECYFDDVIEINRRMRTRERKISQLPNIDALLSSKEMFTDWINNTKKPQSDYIVVDTSKPVNEYIEEVMIYLNGNQQK